MKKLLFICVSAMMCVSMCAQPQNGAFDWQPAGKMSSHMAPYGWQEKLKNVTSSVEKRFQQNGPAEVVCLQMKSDSSFIKKFSVWYPQTMTTVQRYPLVVMVNGTGVPASAYASVFEHLASWGFIVVGNEDKMSGTDKSTSVTLDLMLQESERQGSPFYHHIDTARIGVAGHSQGGSGVFTAVTQWPNGHYYKAAVALSPVHRELAKTLMNADYDVSKMSIPVFITASTLLNFFLHDPDDGKGNRVCGLADMQEELRLIHEAYPKVPVIIARLSDHERNHGENLMESEPYLAAWFCYWLKGDQEAGKAFMGDNAEIKTNTRWQDVETVATK